MGPRRIGGLWKWSWVVAALLALAPTTTFAQSAQGPVGPCPVYLNSLPAGATVSSTGSIIGVLNETRERVSVRLEDASPLNQGTFVDGFRVANATERGVLFGGCGTLAGFAGEISVSARSRIPANVAGNGNANLGIGTIAGAFHIRNSSGLIDGTLRGVLDFVPTNSSVTLCGGPCPFVIASGGWKTSDKVGSFFGVALVPVQPVPGVWYWIYLDPTGVLTGTQNAVVALTPDDFNKDGQPEAKFIINLFD